MRSCIIESITATGAALALGISLAACGGGQGGDVSRFTGTWSATSGTVTVTCPGQNDSWSVTGTVRWDKGLASDLVQATPPCIVDADVTGSTASGAGQTCSYDDGAGGTYTLTRPNYTFVLAPDGRTAQENASGTLVDTNGGASLACTFSETASYTKLGD
ncbi:MAG TPA: hypothetical protein VHL80_01430 [Polyangia bacterium]|nr:hypothetical protein [Polyangia bacterium]